MKIGYCIGKYSQQFGCNYYFEALSDGREGTIALSNRGLGGREKIFTDEQEAISYRDEVLDEEWKIYPVVIESDKTA